MRTQREKERTQLSIAAAILIFVAFLIIFMQIIAYLWGGEWHYFSLLWGITKVFGNGLEKWLSAQAYPLVGLKVILFNTLSWVPIPGLLFLIGVGLIFGVLKDHSDELKERQLKILNQDFQS